jgi:putative Mg2+ transporter-C (MgtC) family protein
VETDFVSDTLLTETVLLLCAFVLSGIVGVERELRNKSAGARTHILVGLGSALFTLVSAYGFTGVIGDQVVLDPSRIAAQIVSGIGFIGAGVIFVRQNIVSGLTTAGSVWVTAAVGMACGAGMPLTAAITVGLYLLATTLMTLLMRRIPRASRDRVYAIRYADGKGVLRQVLRTVSERGFEVALSHTRRAEGPDGPAVIATLRFTPLKGADDSDLFEALSEIPGVLNVEAAREEND